ncbi:MAG TPA: Ldh family oxidoreductase [Burkholderiaceae bacterium]|nr:Ldh family oxidoreductase [Burkholderiaceae bacterium]
MVQPVAADSIPCPAERLIEWGTHCLRAVGVGDAEARLVAESLVQTNLWGIDSHGIARLTHYLNRIVHGSIKAVPNIVVTPTGPCTAKVAGDQGLGIVVAHRAMEVAMVKARANGIGAVGVADSSHCGAIGLYARSAARTGLIGIAFTHSDKIAAPHGGHQPFLGTNPIAMAFPREGSEPVCLDMATTPIPWNRVMNARREGHALPPDVAVDANGAPTTEAHAAAALRPLGGLEYGHKGYGLALVVELLCGPLNGNLWGPQIGPMYAELTRPRRIGAFFIAIDPARFAGGASFAASVEQIARALAAQPGQVMMPGDPELAEERRRRADGVPIEPGLRDEMRAWSERLKVTAPL